MEEKEEPKPFPYWPFWFADGIFLLWAVVIWVQTDRSGSPAATSFYIVTVGLAFVCGILPVYLRKWQLHHQKSMRENHEFQKQVALTLNVLLDKLDFPGKEKRDTEKELRSLIVEMQKESAHHYAKGEKTLQTAFEQLIERIQATEGGIGELKKQIMEFKDEKTSRGRRGVSGILYPEHAQASWLGENPHFVQDLLGEQIQEIPAGEKSKGKKGKAADSPEVEVLEVWVSALIGIGNKPFIRGNLSGLSSEKGIPMEFVEIGKWKWVGDYSEEEGMLEIWLNDEQPAKENPVIVDQKRIEIRPTF